MRDAAWPFRKPAASRGRNQVFREACQPHMQKALPPSLPRGLPAPQLLPSSEQGDNVSKDLPSGKSACICFPSIPMEGPPRRFKSSDQFNRCGPTPRCAGLTLRPACVTRRQFCQSASQAVAGLAIKTSMPLIPVADDTAAHHLRHTRDPIILVYARTVS